MAVPAASDLPSALVAALRAGECVAFVGAGFTSAAGLPTWRELLAKIADEVSREDLRAYVDSVLSAPGASAHDYDRIAQLLVDDLGRDRFLHTVRTLLACTTLPPRMQRRLELLRGIPFRAILTTNFDGVLDGSPAGADSYRALLRRARTEWWNESMWDTGGAGVPVVTLHGNVRVREQHSDVVFSREDYRRRLYHDPAYANCLRSLFSTSTVLYLGFSFTDAYLSEIQSEVLSMFQRTPSPNDSPVAYALLNDAPAAVHQHYLRHEGIQLISFDSSSPPDFGAFDVTLEQLHALSSPRARLAEALHGRRILWMDPTRDARFGRKWLCEIADDSSGESVQLVGKPSEAVAALESAKESGRPVDLVITQWHGTVEHADGLTLLLEMRRRDLRAPVVIFATERDADERRRVALALGAHGYCVNFGALFRTIVEILSPLSDTDLYTR